MLLRQFVAIDRLAEVIGTVPASVAQVSALQGQALAYVLAAFTAAGAMFLILEFYSPVTGIIRIPPSTLESAVDIQAAPLPDGKPPDAR